MNWIDARALDPFKLNDTARFYFSGFTGINISPARINHENFCRYRIKDINLRCTVDRTGEGKLFKWNESVFQDPAASTAPLRSDRFEIDQVLTLDNIIDVGLNKVPPTVLFVRNAGKEIEVLSSLAGHRPKIMCVEIRTPMKRGQSAKPREDLLNFIESMGYEIYANTGLNGIFYYRP